MYFAFSVEAFNNCEKPEEMYDESEHIFTKYTEGSVVLAKMDGYPWCVEQWALMGGGVYVCRCGKTVLCLIED